MERKAERGVRTENPKVCERCLLMGGEGVEACERVQRVKLWRNRLVELKANPRMQIIEKMCP